ncbi:class I SAM-dependent methyltransferase [Bacillus massiliigorillae]|uniref:class I SAM-dependent methyltransferase n=1 Tax=Bacillus massiliigorillae TaxID=1243664 RepID=UPI0003A1D78C|nr:SAM-dependent methyltransferase [Bacillus massiliigorillae]
MEKILKSYISSQKQPYITFKEYMDLALYHPEFGYYNSNQEKIGRHGDFYTSSNLSDVFGRALGRWFIHLFATCDIPRHIIELGAGTGRIAHAVLAYIQEQDEELFNQLQYTVIESSPFHGHKQKSLLENYENVYFIKDLESIGELRGIIFSNELFDAFPVHVIERKEGITYEVMVTADLHEQLIPLQNAEIEAYLEVLSLDLVEGQRIEIPLSMVQYYRTLCTKITKGILVTIDYGYTNEEWKEDIHRRGSLRGYYQHSMYDNVLQKAGEMDLTAHIHWDALRVNGKEQELHSLSFQRQNEFLLSCGILEELSNTSNPNPFSTEHKRNRAIRTLIEPGQISSHFQVLIQSKNIEIKNNNLFPTTII